MEKKEIILMFLCSITMSIVLSGCVKKQNTEPVGKDSDIQDIIETKAGEVYFIDDIGREVRVNHPQKVAVVKGSFAEVWLLAGGELAAVTEDAYDEPNLDLKDDVVNLGNLKAPNIEKMIEADIDFVILSSKLAEHVALRDTMESAGINCAYFEVETFHDYLDMLKICTDITGDSESYKTNGENIQEQIDEVISGVSQEETGKTVLFIRAFSTGAKAKGSDNMTGIMLKELGCINIADSEDGVLEELNMEKIIEADPDYIFVVTMGSSEEKALEVVKESLTEQKAWKDLSAVKNEQYIILPKELFHLKPNARWGESYQMLAEILYGE